MTIEAVEAELPGVKLMAEGDGLVILGSQVYAPLRIEKADTPRHEGDRK